MIQEMHQICTLTQSNLQDEISDFNVQGFFKIKNMLASQKGNIMFSS